MSVRLPIDSHSPWVFYFASLFTIQMDHCGLNHSVLLPKFVTRRNSLQIHSPPLQSIVVDTLHRQKTYNYNVTNDENIRAPISLHIRPLSQYELWLVFRFILCRKTTHCVLVGRLLPVSHLSGCCLKRFSWPTIKF